MPQKNLKILTVFGTRPEVIKLAPFIKEAESDPECISVTCATSQHRELQNDVLQLFQIKPDYDLNVMLHGQDLFHITNTVLEKIKTVLEQEAPDYVVVQGDTTTAFIAALAGFYKKIPVVHIEAGLRTGNLYSPFPEEANRSIISRIASMHMAPTEQAVSNLNQEGIIKNVYMAGNTIVDSVAWVIKNCLTSNAFIKEKIKSLEKKVLITVHRRENFGEPLSAICTAIKELCTSYPEYIFVWPIHPNPNVGTTVFEMLKGIGNLHLIEPLPYSDLLLFINACSLILSDSGGIQEEACILRKRIIILREDTERPEVIEAGFGILVGADRDKICDCFKQYADDSNVLSTTNLVDNIYGTVGVSKNILSKIKEVI